MTEKEIIINGVDVSGCEHCKHIYKNGEGECAAYFLENGDSTVSCSEIPNCYYKQLKRLEQENAKLKDLLETRCYNEVEFENKKLKEKLEKIKEICQTYDQNGVYYNLTEDIMKVIEGEGEE